MDFKGTFNGAGATSDNAALLSRVMHTDWRTWNAPEMTSESMNYGAARGITVDKRSELAYEKLLDSLEIQERGH